MLWHGESQGARALADLSLRKDFFCAFMANAYFEEKPGGLSDISQEGFHGHLSRVDVRVHVQIFEPYPGGCFYIYALVKPAEIRPLHHPLQDPVAFRNANYQRVFLSGAYHSGNPQAARFQRALFVLSGEMAVYPYRSGGMDPVKAQPDLSIPPGLGNGEKPPVPPGSVVFGPGG